MNDLLHPFLFERSAVRGAIVQLDAAWRFMRSLRDYPPVVEALLGQSLVACALLASTLKRTHGSLLLQMQGDGALKLLVAECSSDFGLRGTARYADDIAQAPLRELIGNGRCVITLGGRDAHRYQGIVPLEAPTLARALEDYMQRSEQLESRLVLHAEADAAAGLLVQRVPDAADSDPDDWNRIQHLALTASGAELRALSAPTLLRRLFPFDDVRLFESRALAFACSCSNERVHNMLRGLGREEVESVLAQQGRIEVICEFCGQAYRYSPQECLALFQGGTRS